MKWIKVEDELPEVDRSGESKFVLASAGGRFIPQIVKYANGDWTKKGWWTPDGKHFPFYSGKGKTRQLRFKYWAEIKLPKSE